MKKYRLLQIITGFHAIHSVRKGYGIKIPLINMAYFKNYGFKKLSKINIKGKEQKEYHNCTLTNVY